MPVYGFSGVVIFLYVLSLGGTFFCKMSSSLPWTAYVYLEKCSGSFVPSFSTESTEA